MLLNDRDLIEEPVRASLIGDIFGAVGEKHGAVDRVAISVLAAGKLRQVGFVQYLGQKAIVVRHRYSPVFSGGIARVRSGPIAAQPSQAGHRPPGE
jgi:hypothetical protein